jgi:hypothetical protein
MKKTILSLLVAVGLIGSASAAVFTGDLNNGLVAYYSFDGNANDSVGGNNGTVQGNASFASDSGFHINLLDNATTALNLQGGGYVTLPTVPVNLSADFSVNFWCYGDPAGNGSYVDGSGIHRVDNFISTGLEGSGGLNVRFTSFQSPRWQCFSGNVANVANPFIGSDQPEYVSNWNFVSYIQSGNTTELFINGSLAASMSNTPVASSLGTLTIGYHNSADPIGAYYMYGKMSDLSFYNTALSSSQVSQLYTLQSAPEPSTYALFGIGAIGMLMVIRRKKAA